MLIDAHTHVHFAAYEKDRDAVVQRARLAGIKMVCVGTQRDTSAAAIALAKQYPQDIWATVGLHPVHTEKSYHDAQELGGGEAAKAFTSRGEEFDYAYYKKLAGDSKVVAIGECGLDYYRSDAQTSRQKQEPVFLQHIKLAEENQKALMIHCRPTKGTDDAYEDLLGIISSYQLPVSKIAHFYVGNLAMTKKLLEAGFYFTFGGVVTFTHDYDETIAYIPLDRILLETDAPYVAPAPYRGKQNEPAYLVETAKKMAELKNVDYEKITETTTANALRVFKIKGIILSDL